MSAVKYWVVWLVLSLCCTNVLAQQPVLSVYNNGEYILTDYLYFHEDKENQLGIDDLRRANTDDLFTPLKDKFLTFGLTQSSLWFRMRIRYPNGAPNVEHEKQFYYEVARSHLEIAELHIVRSDGSVTTITSDIRTKLPDKPVPHINSVFPFSLGLGEEITLYLRVHNSTGTFLPQTLWTPAAFATKVTHEEYLYGIFYGGMLIMLVYNMLLFVSSKNETYLYYSGYLLVVILFEFVDIGHGFNLFGDDFFAFHKHYIGFYFWLLWLVGMRYTQHFLEIPERHPAINIAVNAYYFISFFSLLIALRYNYYATIQYSAHFGGTAVLIVLALSIYVWHKGNESAAFFTYAWACNMGGFALYSSVVVGLTPALSILLFSMPLGTMLEAVVLSLALADRIKRAEKQKLDANQRAMENLSRYRSVFDNAIEGLYQMSLTGRMLSVNKAFSRMLGYSSAAQLLAQSRSATECLYADRKRQYQQLVQTGLLSEEIRSGQHDQHTFQAMHVARLVRDSEGQPLHIEGKLTDISERKEKERAQRERLRERREKDVAQRATNSKSEFLKHMSFEIRTPLSAIIGYGECLQNRSLSTQEKHRAITAITENSHNLLHLINNILDYSKIEASKMVLESMPVDLQAMIEHTHTELQGLLAQKDVSFAIELTPPVPTHIMGDHLRLQQILLNLCSNAIKFTKKGGITINLRWNGETSHLTMAVQDTGVGMSPEALHSLRRALATRHSNQPPKGLGLTISNQLMRLSGGELSIESTLGAGTTVALSIPTTLPANAGWIRQPLTTRQKVSALHDIPQLTGRVLVAEDNIVNQKLIERVIMKTGAEVVIVGDGQQALEIASTQHFDLILMDVNMPVMGGLEATAALRASGYVKPVYALTAESGKEEIEACLAAGCNGHLGKPLELTMFYSVLGECLSRRHPEMTRTERAQT